MTINATPAKSRGNIVAGMALTQYEGDPDRHAVAIATLAVLTGVVMLLAGLLKLGKLLRFIANSMVIGFLTGVSINVILSQLGDFSGYSSAYSNKVVKAIDTLLHLDQVHPQTVAIGVLTVVVILLADRTRLRTFSLLIGMVAGSVALIILSSAGAVGWTEVQQVNDIAVIPTSLPMPKLPDFTLMPALLLDATHLSRSGVSANWNSGARACDAFSSHVLH